MNGISPLWQHAQAYRNPQVRTRPKTRRPWKCRQRLRYRQHPRNHRRHRSRHKIQVIRNVRRPSILSLRALNPRMGRRAQLPIPVTTKARVKSFPRRIRCRIFGVKPKPDPEKEAQQRIIIAKLPEMERTLVALIRECRKRHLIVTPDALLRVARETVPDEIPNIGTILELLGALELKGVIERDAGILKLSSRVG